MKANDMLLMFWDDDIGQHGIPTNTPETQETNRNVISVIGNNGMSLDMVTIK